MRGKTNSKTVLVVSVFLLVVLGISSYSEAQEPFMVADINPGAGRWGPKYLTNINGTLFFVAHDDTHGEELWKSDGTSIGTVMVSDIRAGGSSSGPIFLTNVNGTLFFRAENGTHGFELWKSDGTSSGTVMVADIRAGVYSSEPANLLNINGTLYFGANDGTHGTELWKSDGTEAGTVMVMDINPDPTVLFGGSYSRGQTNVNGTLFFVGTDGTHGFELWRSDGTSSGTVMVADIIPGSSMGSLGGWGPRKLTNVNGTLFYQADDGTHGEELWKSDGTSSGTVMVSDIRAGSASSYPGSDRPKELANVNGTLFFSANNGTHGQELWKSDGTSSGTVFVRDIYPGPIGSRLRELINVNGTLFFIADDGTHGDELWKSDGTTDGTVMVADIYPGGEGSSPHWWRLRKLTNVNGTLFFIARDGVHGEELWESDGTTDGTVMVADIYPGPVGSNPCTTRDLELININGTLFFRADDGTHGEELWAYNSNRIFVDTDATGANNGLSWADAYLFIQDALTRARSGYEIFVAQGTYKPDQGAGLTLGDRMATFQLKNDVAIYGGFPSGGGTWAQRDPSAYKTILSGDIGTPGDNTDNSYHVVTGSLTDATAVLDGFTLTGAYAGDFDSARSGGGMRNEYGSPTIKNCLFQGNAAYSYGGGMYNISSHPKVTDGEY